MKNNLFGSTEAINSILAEARRLISEHSAAVQVNLIASADGRVYSFFRYDLESEEQENRCLEQMEADKAQARYIVCMWDDGCVDMPRYSLRQKLTERDPQACLLLRGEHGITAFPLTAITSR